MVRVSGNEMKSMAGLSRFFEGRKSRTYFNVMKTGELLMWMNKGETVIVLKPRKEEINDAEKLY
jgi:hypothetical protein